MTRTLKKTVGLGFVAVAVVAGAGLAQQPPAPVELREVTQRELRAPDYGISTGDLGGAVPSLNQNWLKVEARYESQPEWLDEVTVKFFVLLGRDRDSFVLLVGEVTPVNLARGTHYAAMFVHPNTLKRFGNRQVTAVVAQVFYKGKLIGARSDNGRDTHWVEEAKPVSGFLLAPKDSPWAPVASGRYEPTKTP